MKDEKYHNPKPCICTDFLGKAVQMYREQAFKSLDLIPVGQRRSDTQDRCWKQRLLLLFFGKAILINYK